MELTPEISGRGKVCSGSQFLGFFALLVGVSDVSGRKLVVEKTAHLLARKQKRKQRKRPGSQQLLPGDGLMT